MLGLLGLYAYVLVTAPYKLTSTVVEIGQSNNSKTTNNSTTIISTGNVTFVGTRTSRSISKHIDHYVNTPHYSLMPNWNFAYKLSVEVDWTYLSLEIYYSEINTVNGDSKMNAIYTLWL
uniref:Uncharacterized protein n=1 Tax=Euplotes harpa TaxID=151035 RepID=A0A7S3JA01_9SPIT|mmetsp:Transcript_25764/g.29666  ORF Transcript_25764/g.29666 Transcript_25764/m.29666 type:complete len:119 (+) Transcript_25764:144-500(+)